MKNNTTLSFIIFNDTKTHLIMKWHLLISFFLLSITSAFAQSDEYKEPSKASQAYHEYRMYVSEPPYGLAKIKRLLINMEVKEDEESMGGTEKIPTKIYCNLSLREKFTYHMLHGETFSQICDAYGDLGGAGRCVTPSLTYFIDNNDRNQEFCGTADGSAKHPFCTIAEALLRPARAVRMRDAVGETAAEYLWAYPPGVPLVAPGEEVTAELVTACRALEQAGTALKHTGGSGAEEIAVL